MRLPVGLLSLLFVFSFRCRAAGGTSAAVSTDRLPDDTRPESYVLAVDPDPRSGTFEGRVDISILVTSTTTAITLNARELVLRGVEILDLATNRSVGLRSWTYSAPRERVTIDVDGHVLAGRRYAVAVRFGGRLRDDATGFFRAEYESGAGGEKKWLAATQFKPTHARSAFPCYDEPRFRTPFNISIKTKGNDIALSNMPILNTVDLNKTSRSWVHFMRTPPISTFSVSYFVGEFENLSGDRKNLINVYSHLGSLYQIEYVNGLTSSLLKAVENYTGVKYDLPKLDLLALPTLGLEAAENWGLNTYREESLFIDKNTKTESKISAKILVEKVMAQQWFANLVTPVRWEHAWLSEGFATYFEYFATAMLEPDWRLEHFFVVKELQAALQLDQNTKYSSIASDQMQKNADETLGRVSCDKGAAVLRMLNNWVGEKAFKRALNIFLNKHRYDVVEPEHLWNAFDNALFELTKSNLHGENVHTVMNTWTEQAGYPVVNIAKRDNLLVLTQKRFSIRPSNTNDTVKWFIQLMYTNNVDKNFDAESAPSVWMDPFTPETVVSVANNVKWYIFNIQSSGYYRVNYAEDNWSSLIKQLKSSPAEIHVTNRAQLIDDSFNLARAGHLNYTVPLTLIQYLDKEDDIIPWFSAMNNLNYILERMRRSEDGYVDVKEYVSKIAGVAFQKVNKLIAESQTVGYPVNVGWNAFSMWACKLDDSNCVKIALEYFRRWRNGEEIPTDFKDAAFCTGIRENTEEGDWQKMLDLYKFTKTYSEKESALNALACTENVQLLIANLEFILKNQSSIEPNDYKAFFKALSSTPSGITALTYYLQNHFTYILKNVTDGENMVTTIYSTLASKVSTEREIAKLTDIARTSPLPYRLDDPSSPLNEYYDEVVGNEKWFDDRSRDVREFVRPGSTATTEAPTQATTHLPPEQEKSASAPLKNCVILLQILALSVSAKFFVCVD